MALGADQIVVRRDDPEELLLPRRRRRAVIDRVEAREDRVLRVQPGWCQCGAIGKGYSTRAV